SCAASLLSISASAAFVWTAPILSHLLGPGSEVPMSAEESSWVVSIVYLGNILMTVVAGHLVDVLGRKVCLLAAAPFLLVSWGLILATRSVAVLYVARILHGVTIGILWTVFPIYLGEISGAEIRATTGFFLIGAWYAGTLFEFSIGPYLSYQTYAWVSASPVIAFIVTFVWMPESPYYCLMRGRVEEATAGLRWLRANEDVTAELEAMRKSIQEEEASPSMVTSLKTLLTSEDGRTSLGIAIITYLIFVMSGGEAMFSYAPDMFRRAQDATPGYTGMSPHEISILMASLVLFLAPFCGITTDKLGRRPVFIVSSVGCTFFLILTTVYFYLLLETTTDLSSFRWLPYFTLISYCLVVACGTESIVPVLQAEVFSNECRGAGIGFSSMIGTIVSFLYLKMYETVADHLGVHFLYGGFAIASALGTLYIYYYVPETKGKTFAEIQELIAAKKRPRNS
ncbi:hypothetical protein AAG570_004759, partial [Ranatra chinensis]